MSGEYFSGQGKVYLAERNALGQAMGFEHSGNVPVFEVSTEVSKFEHKESTTGQRAIDLATVKERKGSIKMTVEDLSLKTLALYFWGEYEEVAGASITDEPVLCYVGKRCPVGRFANLSSVVVKDALGGGATALVLGTDYTLDAKYGILIPKAGGAITDGDTVYVSATHGAMEVMDAFDRTSNERWVRFEGLSTLEGGGDYVGDVFRVQLDPLTGLGLINEDLASYEVTGSILYDELQADSNGFFRFLKF